jgi:hypothetical protein
MNLGTQLEYDRSLALVHIGILLAEWDETLIGLPSTLFEVEDRLIKVFGINIRAEQDIFRVRDKVVAMAEIYDNVTGAIQ